jgi:peptidyl-prolyl cis-trans isomerase SurA
MQSRFTLAFRIALACAAPAATGLFAVPAAQAQQLVLTVNGDPITSYDVEQHMKLLRVLKRPAGRPEAIESLIVDRLKLREMSKYQIAASEQDILTQGARDGAKAKLSPQALGQALQSARIDERQWKDHFRAEYVWNVYVAALNKTVEVSEADVRNELAKRGKNTAVTEYVLRQVVLVVPGGAGPNVFEGRAREAQGLRTRFTDCTQGQALARAMNEVAVKEPVTRSSATVNDKLRETLDHTEIGHLTPPERTATGLEMIAVCSKKNVKDDNTAGADIRNELLYARLEGESQKLFADIRKRAVIVRN